jgi:methylglutaconyl-CoA hydratase
MTIMRKAIEIGKPMVIPSLLRVAVAFERSQILSSGKHVTRIRFFQSQSRELIVEHHQDAYITIFKLNRPRVRNALGQQLIHELSLALDDLESQYSKVDTNMTTSSTHQTRCVILTSQTPHIFCAGADLQERAVMSLPDAEQTVRTLQTTFHRFYNLPIPTIAAIEGMALGGGMELAAAVDIRIASPSAMWGLPETTLGILPGAGGTQRCSRLLGTARTMDLILTGRKFDSRLAYEYGLVQYLVEEPEDVFTKAWE